MEIRVAETERWITFALVLTFLAVILGLSSLIVVVHVVVVVSFGRS